MKLGIDILRHFLTIFVILQHMTSSRYSIDVNAEISSYEDFIDGAVAGFFIISGYYSKKQTDLLKFTRLLAIRLLVPFFIFSVTYTLILFALDKSSLSDGLYKTITLHGAGMQLYFLPYLLVVSFSFAIIRYITGEKDTMRNFGILTIILYSYSYACFYRKQFKTITILLSCLHFSFFKPKNKVKYIHHFLFHFISYFGSIRS